MISIDPPSVHAATQRIRTRALEIGFDAVGIASVSRLEAIEHYEAWLAARRHGEMRWLASDRHRERRAEPERVLRGLRSVVCVALFHDPASAPERDARLGRIARYAAGEDYHRVMGDLLGLLEAAIRETLPGAAALGYSDTGAILERGWAERAGLGWVGKNTCVISPTTGSWMVLGEVLVDRDLEADAPIGVDHCGTCRRCLDGCPTGAIVAPRELDARRCISYLTIELRGPIPRELRPLVGDWVFGCDICQDVCPWNRFAPPAREARLHARTLEGWTLERFLTLDEPAFRALFATSPIRRAKRDGFVRNVCVALGNRGDASAITPLVRTLGADSAPLVRGHAAWALGEIGRRAGPGDAAANSVRAALAAAQRDDPAPEVREEAVAALSRLDAPPR